MFKARMISLSGDLIYQNIQVLHLADMVRLGIDPYFGAYTCVFFADGKCVHVHYFNINLIQIDRHPRTSSHEVDEIIIGSEMRYRDSYIIKQEQWAEKGIPNYFAGHEDLTGQFVWSNNEGTFITLDSNVVSIINPDPRRTGATAQKVLAKSTKPSPIVRKIKP